MFESDCRYSQRVVTRCESAEAEFAGSVTDLCSEKASVGIAQANFGVVDTVVVLGRVNRPAKRDLLDGLAARELSQTASRSNKQECRNTRAKEKPVHRPNLPAKLRGF